MTPFNQIPKNKSIKLRLFKSSSDTQLGHLYEHIFLNVLGEKLHNLNYLSYLDYLISGETYRNGVITFEFSVFNKDLENEILNIVNNLEIDFTDEIIGASALQILAEKQLDSDGFIDTTVTELNKLHKQKFKNIEDVNETESIPTSYDNYLNMYEASENDFHKTKFSFYLDKQSSEDVLIFDLVSKILANNSIEIIEREFYAFNLGVEVDYDTNILVSSFTTITSNGQEEDLHAKQSALENTKTQILNNEIIERIIHTAKNIIQNNLKSQKDIFNKEKIIDVIDRIKLEVKTI